MCPSNKLLVIVMLHAQGLCKDKQVNQVMFWITKIKK